MKDFVADPQQAFPGHGRMKPEQVEIERLMRQQALRARPRRRRVPPDTGARSTTAVAPNVLGRTFDASSVNRKWVADFT